MAEKKRGGHRAGAGRPKGRISSLSTAIRRKAAASGELPHEFLLKVARGEKIDGHKPTFPERMAAANMAAPYYAPKLASTQVTGANGGPIEHRIADARNEVERKLAGLVAADEQTEVSGKPH